MYKSQFRQYRQWFTEYTDGFLVSPDDDQRENFNLKIKHTLRVCGNAQVLARSLALPEEELFLARTAALFHDIGRFDQYARYRTFADFRSEDHASLGVLVLKNKGILAGLPGEEREILFCGVLNHNKALIPDGLTERQLLHLRILRDADKLDIWKLVLEYYREGGEKDNPSVVHNLPPGKDVCEEIYQAVLLRKPVSYHKMQSVVDMKVMQMGWIFDLNTPRAVGMARERGVLDAIYKTLPGTERIKNLYRQFKEYEEQTIRELL